MLRYEMIKGEPYLVQDVARPSVYLDQWALNLVARDIDFRTEFIRVTTKVKATVLYSYASFIELGKIDDPEQIDHIADVMDTVDYGFLEINSFVVIREFEIPFRKSRRGRESIPLTSPVIDKNIVQVLLRLSHPFEILKPSKVLRSIKEEDSDLYRRLPVRLSSLTERIEKARSDKDALKRAQKRFQSKSLTGTVRPYTYDIQRRAFDFIVVNKTMKMTPNEWIDFFHTVVPTAYCDFVLLDKRWAEFVRRHVPLKWPEIAHVYTRKELPVFLHDLETFESPV